MSFDELKPKTKTAPDYVIEALQAFLQTTIPGLTVYTEWPYANQQLKYPTVTITKRLQKREPLNPIETIASTVPDVNNKVIVTQAVAEWDATWQLDLWADSKQMRSEMTQKLIEAINIQEVSPVYITPPPVKVSDIDPKIYAVGAAREDDGLRLQLLRYFNIWADYQIQDSQEVDDEQAAQRQERRTKINMLVNFREIRQRSYYAIKKAQIGLAAQSSEFTPTDILESFNVPK